MLISVHGKPPPFSKNDSNNVALSEWVGELHLFRLRLEDVTLLHNFWLCTLPLTVNLSNHPPTSTYQTSLVNASERRDMAASLLRVVAISMLLLGLGAVVSYGAQLPAMFVFGDSLVDSGNNNDLVTLAKADYSPYGIDFAEGVTGRYCNGGTVADHLGSLLGLPLIPPFNNPDTIGSKILQGVNYGSSASGILNETGKLYGQVFNMNEQIYNFVTTLQELRSIMQDGVDDFISRSLFFVCMASNDYLNNYMLPFSNKPTKYTPEAYSKLLTLQYRIQLQDLYNLGGRKFLIAGLGPLGCIPSQMGNSNDPNTCVASSNNMALQFNANLKSMLDELNTSLQGSYFLYWDTYTYSYEIINNYSQYGFKYQHKACCGGGRNKGQILCFPLLPFECRNRSEYLFWDAYHPTDAFNILTSKHAFNGTLQTTFPMNVQQLVQS